MRAQQAGLSASLVQACSLGRYRPRFKSGQPHHSLMLLQNGTLGVLGALLKCRVHFLSVEKDTGSNSTSLRGSNIRVLIS